MIVLVRACLIFPFVARKAYFLSNVFIAQTSKMFT